MFICMGVCVYMHVYGGQRSDFSIFPFFFSRKGLIIFIFYVYEFCLQVNTCTTCVLGGLGTGVMKVISSHVGGVNQTGFPLRAASVVHY